MQLYEVAVGMLSDPVVRAPEATQFIDLNRLAVGPQCGFASTVAGNPLTEADEARKLRLLVELAGALWPEEARAAAHT